MWAGAEGGACQDNLWPQLQRMGWGLATDGIFTGMGVSF